MPSRARQRSWKTLPAAVAACAFPIALFAQPIRIHGRIDNTRRTVLSGHVRPQAVPANETGVVDQSMPIAGVTLSLSSSPEQQAALDEFLQRQQTPGSPDYHRWLTPGEYAERFGVSESDLAAVRTWLEDQQLTVTGVARSRTWITVSGTAGQLGKAFGTEFRHYRVNGEEHFANATPPSVPSQIGAVVRSIRGLSDFRPRPRKRPIRNTETESGAQPRYTSARGSHYVAPADLAAIYNFGPLYAAGIDGTSQKIVIAGQSRINLADIQHFRSVYGLPGKDPQTVLVPTSQDPGVIKDDQDEAHLDLEWAGATARNATLVYVYATDVTDAVQYAVDQNLAPVISTSYGNCELELAAADAAALRSLARQANAQGITWFAASGDSGAADCAYLNLSDAAVDIPASIPEVTGVGGTQFQEGSGQYWSTTNSNSSGSAQSYIPEVVWNDSALDGQPAASGGGNSQFFSRPSWQTGAGVPGDDTRHVPDVAMASSAEHDGYLVYTQGADTVFGGTSVPVPIYAGLAALLNQYLVARGNQAAPGLGNINPVLYALARSAPGVFHDITSGDNTVTVTCPPRSRRCNPGTVGYSAGPGYDLATGLGSVDAYQLVMSWTSAQVSNGSQPRLTLQTNVSSLGANDTVFLTATAVAADGSTPSGQVKFVQGNTQLGSAALVGSAGTATATLALKGSALAPGLGNVTASVNGLAAQIAVNVGSGGGAAGVPSIAAVTNGASFAPQVAPGAIVSVFGSQLAGSIRVADSLPLPVGLAGVAATVNGIAAPMWYVSPGQINLQIPYEVAPGGGVTLTLNNNGQTATTGFTVSGAAPAIFTDSARNLVPAASAARGDTLVLFVTGAGGVTPQVATGATPAGGTPLSLLPAPQQRLTVTVGGAAAPVVFTGIAPGLVGVVQVNFQVPPGTATGSQRVVVYAGGTASPAASLTVTR